MATGSEEILEGFICPICKKDLVTAILLSTHFQEEHNEDQDVLRSLKDLFGKAKKKILKQDSPEHESGSSPSQTPNQYRTRSSALYSSYQTVGVSRSHMGYFHHIRNSRVERYAAETNKLLIRLDKLLIEMPSDPVKRKAHEQQVVPWVEDADVRLCPNCARPFHILTRRKHHCRLCGAIMCHECSEFITLAVARKLTNPAFGLHRPPLASDVSKDSVQQQLSSPSSSPALNSSALRRSASNSSLGSALSAPLPGLGPSSEPSRLRLCPHCRKSLRRREELWAWKPVITMMYEQLRECISTGDPLITVFHTMSNSLNAGESTYTLIEAQMARIQLLKWAETVDNLSKNIGLLGTTKEDEEPPTGRVLKLQQTVRTAAAQFLRQTISNLPSLPTEKRLKELQENKKREMELEILRERRMLQETQLRESASSLGSKWDVTSGSRGSSPHSHASSWQNSSRVDGSTNSSYEIDGLGWGPENQQQFLNIQDDDDPMVQQINIIRNYIRQAKEAHKYDEVATLETNLKELLEEFYKQLQDQ
ncbi:rabenosyn-5 [Ischnura elegans]|uniref:rabenosyn-5 n=1 Tax=Ischnura elegans TaxID=197161 RepID=UPI001ED881A9|nr:rabenosyn-5 [Ischnura elegans]